MRSLDIIIETVLDRTEGNGRLLLIWVGLTFLCSLFAFAIFDYEQVSQAQLERVHAAGMAVGSTMCGRYSQ